MSLCVLLFHCRALHIAVVQGQLSVVYKLIQLLLLARKSLDIFNNLRQVNKCPLYVCIHLTFLQNTPHVIHIFVVSVYKSIPQVSVPFLMPASALKVCREPLLCQQRHGNHTLLFCLSVSSNTGKDQRGSALISSPSCAGISHNPTVMMTQATIEISWLPCNLRLTLPEIIIWKYLWLHIAGLGLIALGFQWWTKGSKSDQAVSTSFNFLLGNLSIGNKPRVVLHLCLELNYADQKLFGKNFLIASVCSSSAPYSCFFLQPCEHLSLTVL